MGTGEALDEVGGNRVKEPVEALEKRDGDNLHHTRPHGLVPL